MRSHTLPLLVPVLLTVGMTAAGSGIANDEADRLIAEGTQAWRRRAEGASPDGRPLAQPIGSAISAWQSALEQRPDDVALRARLIEALLFEGEYVELEQDERRQVLIEGRDYFEEGRRRLAAELGVDLDSDEPEAAAEALAETPGAAALYYWGAAVWGSWGDKVGAMAAVRRGVAGRIRDYGQTALLLDESYDEGGPPRMLGRLHTVAPRVPFFTGWVRRGVGIELLERGHTLGPGDPLNAFFLGDALLRHAGAERRQEGLDLLCRAITQPPRPEYRVEDLDARRQAREALTGWVEDPSSTCNSPEP